MSKPKKATAASVIWFEIPADKPERAKRFYGKLFGWKINPFPGMPDYQHIDTGGADASPDGGLMKRMHPGHTITTYVLVPSVTRFMAKVEKLGGYFLLKVNTLDEAVAIAQQCPGLPYGIRVEVRPVAGECPLVQEVQTEARLAHA